MSKTSPSAHFAAWIWDTVKTWGPAILFVLLVRSVLAEPFRIPSGSMVPTLEIGDHILVTKFSYGLRIPMTRVPMGDLSLPDRGDIVVFVKPGTDDTFLQQTLDLPVPPFATHDYVKRVVGLQERHRGPRQPGLHQRQGPGARVRGQVRLRQRALPPEPDASSSRPSETASTTC